MSTLIGPPAPALGRNVSGVELALLLGVLGVLWFSLPGGHGMLALALILGAYFYAEQLARGAGVPGPLASLAGKL